MIDSVVYLDLGFSTDSDTLTPALSLRGREQKGKENKRGTSRVS
jgi:hypothetical protein